MKKMSLETIQLIQELYDMGLPKKEIAARVNCSVPTITKYVGVTTPPDMIGKEFGRLTVLSLVEKDPSLKNRCLYYECVCDCGKHVIVQGAALRKGHTTSCGCSRIGANATNLLNLRFGKLVVIADLYASSNDHRHLWKCKCDCGNTCEVESKALLSGATKSCGCLRSWKEQELVRLFEQYHINYKKQYTFTDLRDVNPLRFDFAIFNQNNELLYLIEYQGDQHLDINNSWHTTVLEQHDKMKYDYCQKHEYTLIYLFKTDDLESFVKGLQYD